MSVYFPHKEPNESVQALLSATGALDKKDLEEVTRYAEYRKLRRELKKAKSRRLGR
jgi:hypothetical protein